MREDAINQYKAGSPQNTSLMSTPSSASPHPSPRLPGELSQGSVGSQMTVNDRNIQDSRYREAQLYYLHQQQRPDYMDRGQNRMEAEIAPELNSGYNSGRDSYLSNSSYRMVSPREGQECYQDMRSPRDIPDSYRQVLSPREQEFHAHSAGPLPGHNRSPYEVNNFSVPPGLKPVAPSVKPVVPPLNAAASQQRQYHTLGLDTQMEHGQRQLENLGTSSLFPPATSLRSPLGQSQQPTTLNSSAPSFLPSLNVPSGRSASSVPLSGRKPTHSNDSELLEHLNGNQFVHDSQPFRESQDHLSMSPGGSLSNRMSQESYASAWRDGYPQQNSQRYSGTPAGMLAPIPQTFRTGSETNLLAVEIAESILSSSLAPDAARGRVFSSDAASHQSALKPIGNDEFNANDMSTALNMTPRHKTRTSSASASHEISQGLLGAFDLQFNLDNMSRELSLAAAFPKATPRDFSPRITDGWITGRLEEPNSILKSPRSPPFLEADALSQSDPSRGEEYPYFTTKDDYSDTDSTTEEADHVHKYSVHMERSYGEEKPINVPSVTLPFKYESSFYQ